MQRIISTRRLRSLRRSSRPPPPLFDFIGWSSGERKHHRLFIARYVHDLARPRSSIPMGQPSAVSTPRPLLWTFCPTRHVSLSAVPSPIIAFMYWTEVWSLFLRV